MAGCVDEESPKRERKVSVPKVRTVLKQIADELTSEELGKLKFLAADHIPKRKAEAMICLDFFTALQERQLIDTKQDDMDYLIQLLNDLPRVDLVRKLRASLPGPKYTEKMVIKEEIITTDAVVVNNSSVLETTETTQLITRTEIVDGSFLHDPETSVQSICQKYNDTVSALEEERATVTKLKMQNHKLHQEINEIKDEQNNLIRQRNSALGAKSEFVFRESEMRKELSDLKRTNNVLTKNCGKANSEVEARDKEIAELKESLNKSEDTVSELRSCLDEEKNARLVVEEELAVFKKVREDHGHVKCRRCGLFFVEANNPTDACRYHTGHFETVGSIMRRMEWSCCKNANKGAPGCCKKKHLTIDYPLPSPVLGEKDRKFTM